MATLKAKKDAAKKQRQQTFYHNQRIRAEETGDQKTTSKIYSKLGRSAPDVTTDADKYNKEFLGDVAALGIGRLVGPLLGLGRAAMGYGSARAATEAAGAGRSMVPAAGRAMATGARSAGKAAKATVKSAPRAIGGGAKAGLKAAPKRALSGGGGRSIATSAGRKATPVAGRALAVAKKSSPSMGGKRAASLAGAVGASSVRKKAPPDKKKKSN